MPTILVVDDGPIDREVAGGFLREAGFEVLFASDGLDALAVVERAGPSLVVTDLRMPRMDGLALVKEMQVLYPEVPVVLMTAHGSEDVAVAALRAGAANYVPKARLARDLLPAVRVVVDAMEAARERAQVREFLTAQDSRYVLGYEPWATHALVSHLQDSLRQMQLCPPADLVRVGTALTEALSNAIQHGNLELDSALRERSDDAYWALGRQRAALPPYRDRRVHVTVRLTQHAATFVVRDEGPGFDVRTLPDPTDPVNLTRASGRGVLLIRTFMDDVRFNERGNEITMVMATSPANA